MVTNGCPSFQHICMFKPGILGRRKCQLSLLLSCYQEATVLFRTFQAGIIYILHVQTWAVWQRRRTFTAGSKGRWNWEWFGETLNSVHLTVCCEDKWGDVWEALAHEYWERWSLCPLLLNLVPEVKQCDTPNWIWKGNLAFALFFWSPGWLCKKPNYNDCWSARRNPVHTKRMVVQSLSCVRLFLTHELQHTRFPCSSLSPGACSNSCP